MFDVTLTGDDIVIPEPNDDRFTTTITPTQQENLLKLAHHLLSLPNDYPDFEMRYFVNEIDRGRGWDPVFKADCGTAACAVGHGPSAGIDFRQGEDWSDYSFRAFIPDPRDEDNDVNGSDGEPWSWCFASEWTDVDNTAHGAAYRILWLLRERSIPDNALEQREGDDEISYWPEIAPVIA